MKNLFLLKTSVLFLTLTAVFGVSAPQIVFAKTDFATLNKAKKNSADEREIHKLINKERRKKGLPDLNWSNDLERLARSYSKKMADGRFFSHYERNGDSVAQRAGAMKIKGWRKIGENLFMCEAYDKINNFAVENWMKSTLHRQNILDGNYNATGIGIAESRDGTIYIAQVFTQN